MTVTRLGQLTAELQTLADVQPYGGGSGLPTISSTRARTGTYSYRTTAAAAPFGLTLPVQSAVRLGFWLNHAGVSGNAAVAVAAIAVGESVVYVGWNGATNLLDLRLGYVQNSSEYNVVAEAPGGVISTPNTWMHVGVTYKCDEAAGFLSLYLDGALVLTFGGDTTVWKRSSTLPTPKQSGINGVYVAGTLSSAWAAYAYVDDLYVDGYAGEEDAAPSSKRFLFGRVNAAGGLAEQWTPVGDTAAWKCLDETPPDNDTTYAKALLTGKRDVYGCADITVPVDHQVRAVIPVAMTRKTDAGIDSKLKLGLYDGAQTRLGEAQVLPTAYGVRWDRFTAQVDGSIWTEAAVNSQQEALESAGSF